MTKFKLHHLKINTHATIYSNNFDTSWSAQKLLSLFWPVPLSTVAVPNFARSSVTSSSDTHDRLFPVLYIRRPLVILVTFCSFRMCPVSSFDWASHEFVMILLLLVKLLLNAHWHTYVHFGFAVVRLPPFKFEKIYKETESTISVQGHGQVSPISTDICSIPIGKIATR